MKQSAASKPGTEIMASGKQGGLIKKKDRQPSVIPEIASGRDSHEPLGTIGEASAAQRSGSNSKG